MHRGFGGFPPGGFEESPPEAIENTKIVIGNGLLENKGETGRQRGDFH